MSAEQPKKWTWDISNVDNMETRQIKSLLKNRNCQNLKGSNDKLLQRLTENYEIEDENMKPLNQLSLLQLQSELILRDLSPKKGTKEELIDRLKVKQIPTTNTLLVYGYVRENENVLQYGQFIPFYLKELIVSFGQSFAISYYLSSQFPNYLFCATIKNHNNQHWTAKVIELNKEKESDGRSEMSRHIFSTISNSLTLPAKIKKSIKKHRTYSTDTFHMIFNSEGGKISVTLLNEDEINNNTDKDDLIAFKWNMPSIYDKWENAQPTQSLCFDDDYGLLSFSGWYSDLYSLSFKSDAFLQQIRWKWQQLGQQHYVTRNSSYIIIKTDDLKKKLFVAGTSRYNEGKTEMFDFTESKWIQTTSSKKRISHSGICYNNMTQRVYVGGGRTASHWHDEEDVNILSRVQYFHLNKEKWFSLPDTIMEHEDYPILWNDKNDHNVLFIGSIYQNGLEYIDLRMKKRWNVVCVPNNTQSLSNMLRVYFPNTLDESDHSDYYNSRLSVTQI